MIKNYFTIGLTGFIGGILASTMIGTAGCGHRSDLVAVVNGDPISTKEFYQYLQNKSVVAVKTENGPATLSVYGSLGYQALRDLVNQQVELQIARDQGVYPSNAEVEKELMTKIQLEPNYLLDLELEGLTVDTIRKSLTVDLAQERLLTKNVHITVADAKKYVADHPQLFTQQKRIDLSWIKVNSPAEEADIDQALSTGESFNAVALRSSKAQKARAFNGHLTNPESGSPAVADLPLNLQQAIGDLKEQDTTGWVSYDGGYAKFYVNKIIPPKPFPMDALKLELLRRALAKQEGEKKQSLAKIVDQKLKDSKVDIVSTAFQDSWKADMDELKGRGN